jgi:hypothetical protein
MLVKNKTLYEGKIFKSKRCGEFVISEYHNYDDVVVKFLKTGFCIRTDFSDVKRGSIRDPYFPTVCGVGFCGVGPYSPSYTRLGKSRTTSAYTAWRNRIKDCYTDTKSKHLYINATICEEWHNFQNFAKWYYDQERLYGKGGCVDKDLLHLGNKHYSPETARYIPKAVNVLFSGTSKHITGVCFSKSRRKFIAQIHKGTITSKGNRKSKNLGQFDSYVEASSVYKVAKINHVKETVIKYQEQLPPDLFFKLYTGTEIYVDYYMNAYGGDL